ncbi:MAG: hypothetical protein MUF54_08765, partial [Polyangiaceae bacterium]|nr:hypothetical protein [Polyangiaceae bacterium]
MAKLNRTPLTACLLLTAAFGGCKMTCCAPLIDRLRGDHTLPEEPDTTTRVFATPASAFTAIPPTPMTTPLSGHPRLWLRADDLQRLRSWASSDNVVYAQGLAPLVRDAVANMDAGKVPTAGDCAPEDQFCEQYALLFAFMSLVSPDEPARKDFAQRARKVLMHMMDRVAAKRSGDPLAEPRFSQSDRSRWAGEAFGLTVDWIYPVLSAQDKATIRKVFLHWCEEQLHSVITSHNHPEPIGTLNDPVLVRDRSARRYAANNYFTAHMRNMLLMSLALDDPDDPAEQNTGRTYPRLRDYLDNAIGAWLYMTDHVLANDARGGTAAEGFEYAPRSLAFVLQTYWALETAGRADPARYGSQVLWQRNPFWKDVVPAFLHALSPVRISPAPGEGESYEPAWFGDGERTTLLDFVDVFVPLGLSARLHGDAKLLDATRWIQLHTPMGGSTELRRRANAYGGSAAFRQAIFYFLLFDPKAPPPADPRATLSCTHFGEGLNQVFSRTDWSQNASWFTYQL